jgi:hypothetical protein
MAHLISLLIVGAIVLYALHRKGDVKAGIKIPFMELSIDAKDRRTDGRAQRKSRLRP